MFKFETTYAPSYKKVKAASGGSKIFEVLRKDRSSWSEFEMNHTMINNTGTGSTFLYFNQDAISNFVAAASDNLGTVEYARPQRCGYDADLSDHNWGRTGRDSRDSWTGLMTEY